MMEDEQKMFATYSEWADDTTKDLGLEIKSASSQIEELLAFIGKTDADAAQLGSEIGALEAEISKLESEKADATAIRKEQNTQYSKESQDYAESVDALQRAIQTMRAQNYDHAQATAFLQRMSATVSGMPRVLAALQVQGQLGLQRDDGAPEVAAYEFQSGGILEMLESLLDKFRGELADVQKAETNQAHAFATLELHLSNTIKKDSSDRDEKVAAKAKCLTDSANAKGELAQVQADKAADEKLKQDTHTAFRIKTDLFNENQKVRAAELEAIAHAIEILSSDAVAGSYAKHINLAQTRVSFVQVGQHLSQHTDALEKAAGLLRDRAQSLKSGTLASMAAAIAANPFAKVIAMIEDLLAKLKADASAEASHKAWCDEQLHDNKIKRNKKTAQVNKLQSEIEGLSAKIADEGASITTLTEEQADLTKGMAERTQQRNDEHAENTAAIADAAAGAEAVQRALTILKEFYASQSFLQQAQEPEMQAYKGMQNGKTGVLGMLEVIATDFARLKADTETAEAAALADYEKYMKESEALKQQKHKDEVKLRLDKDQHEYEKSEAEKDLKATLEELGDANKYYAELKPSCLEVHVNWEERVAGREAELAALREAYDILNKKSSE